MPCDLLRGVAGTFSESAQSGGPLWLYLHHPPRPLTCSVPLGRGIRPLCFLILVNDAVCDTSHPWKYVDDSNIIIVYVNSTSPDFSELQETSCKLQQWTLRNDVTINNTKAVVMHVNRGGYTTSYYLPSPSTPTNLALSSTTTSPEKLRSPRVLRPRHTASTFSGGSNR